MKIIQTTSVVLYNVNCAQSKRSCIHHFRKERSTRLISVFETILADLSIVRSLYRYQPVNTSRDCTIS